MDSNVYPPLYAVEPDFRRLKLRMRNLSSLDINLLKHSCLCEEVREVEQGFKEYSLIVDREQLNKDMREVQRHYDLYGRGKELYKLAIESILSTPSRMDKYRHGTKAGASSFMDKTDQNNEELLNTLRPVTVQPPKVLQAICKGSDTQEEDECVQEKMKTVLKKLDALTERAEKLGKNIDTLEETKAFEDCKWEELENWRLEKLEKIIIFREKEVTLKKENAKILESRLMALKEEESKEDEKIEFLKKKLLKQSNYLNLQI